MYGHLDIMHPHSLHILSGGDKVTRSAVSQWMCVLWHIKNALSPQTAARCSTSSINRWPAHIRWPLSPSLPLSSLSVEILPTCRLPPAYVCVSLWRSKVSYQRAPCWACRLKTAEEKCKGWMWCWAHSRVSGPGCDRMTLHSDQGWANYWSAATPATTVFFNKYQRWPRDFVQVAHFGPTVYWNMAPLRLR